MKLAGNYYFLVDIYKMNSNQQVKRKFVKWYKLPVAVWHKHGARKNRKLNVSLLVTKEENITAKLSY